MLAWISAIGGIFLLMLAITCAIVLLDALALALLVLVAMLLGWLGELWQCGNLAFAHWPRTRRLTLLTLRWSARAALACTPFVGCTYSYIYLDDTDVPDIQLILNWQPPQIGYIRDRNNAVAMLAFTQARTTVPLNRVPQVVQQAIIAGEDKRFWSHTGVDWTATLTTGVKDVFAKKLHLRQRGASSIDQQVVRKVYPALVDWNRRETHHAPLVDNVGTRILRSAFGSVVTNRITRKIREIKYAVRTEQALRERLGSHRAAKEFMLQCYANLPYLGHGVYGLAYGAQFYFDKNLSELDAAESAFLVSLFPNPEVYGRTSGSSADTAGQYIRRNAVLERMADNGFLTHRQLAHEMAKPLRFNLALARSKTDAPAIVEHAVRELESLGYSQKQLYNGDIQLQLTSDLAIQRIVNAAAWRGINETFKNRFDVTSPLPQIAVVVLDNRSGAVLAEHGGFISSDRRNNYATYNRATRALRQPGSTFKGIDLVAAIMSGVTPETIVYDGPFVINMGGGVRKSVGNYDGKMQGPIQLWEATAQSRNLAFMHLMHDIVGRTPEARELGEALKKQLGYRIDPGAAMAVKWAREMGITAKLNPYISTVIGANGITPLEMANAYRTIASGVTAQPFIIGQITNRDGAVIYRSPDTTKPFSVPPEKLELVQTLLRSTVRLPRGTGRSLEVGNFPIQVMGKTGTSNAHSDALFIGSTYGLDGITIAVWVGHDDPRQSLPYEGRLWYDRASGGVVALPIAKEIFLEVYGLGHPLGNPPKMPQQIEDRIDQYLARAYGPQATK